MERWRNIERKELLTCSIFRVEEVERRSEAGAEGQFYVIDAPDWVTIVPVIRDEEGHSFFLMVEQYRHGSESVTMEFPAGTVDPGESPEVTAMRELREETGYSAGKLTLLGSLSPNPAFMKNRSHTYLAEELEQQGEQELDIHESMRIHLVPVAEVQRLMGSGVYDNAIMAAALQLFNRRQGS